MQEFIKSQPPFSKYLKTKGIDEPDEVILEDIEGIINICLKIDKRGSEYKIADDIVGRTIPENAVAASVSDNSLIKNELRSKLTTADHKYLVLIDLAWDSDSNRDF